MATGDSPPRIPPRDRRKTRRGGIPHVHQRQENPGPLSDNQEATSSKSTARHAAQMLRKSSRQHLVAASTRVAISGRSSSWRPGGRRELSWAVPPDVALRGFPPEGAYGTLSPRRRRDLGLSRSGVPLRPASVGVVIGPAAFCAARRA